MWNRLAQHNAFIITITPRTITFTQLAQPPSTKSLISLQYYGSQTLDALELEHLIVFNPTRIRTMIQQVYDPSYQSIPVLISLNGPSLFSKIISSPHAHPSLAQFNLPRIPHMRWAYHYLYTHNNRHYFYIAGLPQQIILQLQLLSITAKLSLRIISTEQMALLSLYHHLAGSSFRQSNLGIDLIGQQNSIEQLFSPSDLKKILLIPDNQQIQPTDYLPLLSACGLFVSRGWQ